VPGCYVNWYTVTLLFSTHYKITEMRSTTICTVYMTFYKLQACLYTYSLYISFSINMCAHITDRISMCDICKHISL